MRTMDNSNEDKQIEKLGKRLSASTEKLRAITAKQRAAARERTEIEAELKRKLTLMIIRLRDGKPSRAWRSISFTYSISHETARQLYMKGKRAGLTVES